MMTFGHCQLSQIAYTEKMETNLPIRFIYFVFLGLAIAACTSKNSVPAEPTPFSLTSPAGKTWELVWSDEFDTPGLPDPAKWNYEVGYIRNNELQYYTRARPENARVENGNLVIEAIKETYEGANYTSASLITKSKASWTYGRIEARANIPEGRGMWPAIWMLGENIDEVGWPDCGEIDIMENVGFEPDTIHGTVHTGAYNHVSGTAQGASVSVPEAGKDFHNYAIEWDSQRIDFFVDDRYYFTFVNDGTGEAAWPFDRNAYLILNIAVGGAWGGQQGVDDEIFPQQMLIDYVRVFKTSGKETK
jgi:beta-glucanase (GH16 family)